MKSSRRKDRALRAGKALLELLWPRSARRIMEEKEEERRATRASLPHSPFLECHAILAVSWTTLQKIPRNTHGSRNTGGVEVFVFLMFLVGLSATTVTLIP